MTSAEGERKKAQAQLETAADMITLYRTQGRADLLAELLKNIDPAHRPYGT